MLCAVRSTEQRRASLPANTAAPAITGTVKTGNSVTVAPGTWTGSPSLTYTLKRGATTIVGPGASKATVQAYAFVAADAYAPVALVETDSVSSTSATSNALVYVLATAGTVLAQWDADHGVTGTSPITAVADQSGNGYGLSQPTANRRPYLGAGAGPNGHNAFDMRDATGTAGVGKSLITTGLPGSKHPTTQFLIANPDRSKGSSGYLYDNVSGAQRALFKSATKLFAGAEDNLVTVPGSGWFLDVAVFNGASSKHAINAGSATTGSPGTNALSQLCLGDYGGSGGATTFSNNGHMAYCVIFDGALSDADRADVTQYLMGWAGL